MISIKQRTIILLVLAEVFAMGLWFVSAAILNDLQSTGFVGPSLGAWLSSAVPAGFVVGALFVAISGIADRLDPRYVLCGAALLGALFNGLLVVLPPGSALTILLRFLTGVALAGVYPVGMKIMVGWGTNDRGLLVGLLVGGLTLGSSSPHLLAWLGGAQWQTTVIAASVFSVLGGLLVLTTKLGPNHASAASFDPSAITEAWTNLDIRRAFGGYFGHMWELYAMWSWLGVAAAVSYQAQMGADDASQLAKLTAFVAIGGGALLCPIAGKVADKIGKAKLTILVMMLSGTFAMASALVFEGPVVLVFSVFVLWGLFIIPDSAQFSALVADLAPPERAGSLLTLQTALGFLLTIATVQLTPIVADFISWPGIFIVMALGPVAGIVCMWPLMKSSNDPA